MPAKKGRRKGTFVERQQAKVYGEVKEIVSVASGQRMTIREATFARLVALEGYSYTDAYIESFHPLTSNQASLNVMAHRIAKRERVVNEIERLKRKDREEAESKENRPRLLRDSEWLRDQILNGLYTIATSEADAKVRATCWRSLGESDHVQLFKRSTSIGNTTVNVQQNNLGVQLSDDTHKMRSEVVNRLQVLLSEDVKALPPSPEPLHVPETNDFIDVALEQDEVIA